MAVGSGASYRVDFSEVREMLEDLKEAKLALNAMDPNKGLRGYSAAGTRMERELRRQVKIMSDRVIVPAVKERGMATGDPLTMRIAQTVRAKNDRLPIVKVGAVNPKVSGFKRTDVEDRKRARGQLAWGTEKGPWHEGRKPGIGSKTGAYAKPSNETGYWVYWAVNSGRVTRGVIQGYSEVVDAVFAKFSKWGTIRKAA